MKIISITTLFFFICCHRKISSQAQYMPEYKKYQHPVAARMKVVDKNIADTASIILNRYLHRISIYSCTWCVAEGEVFQPVAAFVKQHPESLVFILDSALSGTALTWGFRVLFKQMYPVQYKKVLQKANIVLPAASDIQTENQRWQNQVKEYSLPFYLLADEYLEND
jgi:hypothetical protein